MSSKKETTNRQLIRRVRWYVKLRWFYLLGLSVPGLTSIYISEGVSEIFLRSVGIACAGLVYNGIFYSLSRRKNGGYKYFVSLGWMQIISDSILATSLIISGGGVESRSIVVYAIGIIMSGSMFGPWATYVTSGISIFMYDAVILLDLKGVFRSGDISAPNLHGDVGYAVTTIAFYSIALLVIGAVSNFVTNLLSEQQKQAKLEATALDNAQHIAKLGSWEWDMKSNRVTWSNELYRIFGFRPGQIKVTYEVFLRQIYPEDRKRVDAIIRQSGVDHKPFDFEHRIVLPSGDVRVIHAQGQVITDSNNQAIGMRGTGQDVTERAKIERNLFRRTKELETLNKTMIGRELKMIELKKQIQKLSKTQGSNSINQDTHTEVLK